MVRLVRTFSLDSEVSRALDDASPRGERSSFVNDVLREALQATPEAQ